MKKNKKEETNDINKIRLGKQMSLLRLFTEVWVKGVDRSRDCSLRALLSLGNNCAWFAISG